MRNESRSEKILGAVELVITIILVAAALCVGVRGAVDGETIERGLSVIGAGAVTVWIARLVAWLETGKR